jgi:hypothetical protein
MTVSPYATLIEHKYPLQPRRLPGTPYFSVHLYQCTMDWYRLMPAQCSTALLNTTRFLVTLSAMAMRTRQAQLEDQWS